MKLRWFLHTHSGVLYRSGDENMGRTICLWLISFLALGNALPVQESASEQTLIDMILKAKPEENDIEFHADAPSIPLTENLDAKVINPETEQLQDPSEDNTPSDTINVQNEPELPSIPITDDLQVKEEANDDRTETPGDTVEEEQEYPLSDHEASMHTVDRMSSVIDVNSETEPQPNPEETVMVNFGNEEQIPTIVVFEESQVNEGISPLLSEEPLISDFVEEQQTDEEMILDREEDYIVNADMPPSEAEPVEDMLSMPVESQEPVYFETYDSQEPMPEPLDDHLDVPEENPIEQVFPSTAIDMDENKFSVFEVPSNVNAFPVEASEFLNEGSQLFDDSLKDFYIPEREVAEDEDYVIEGEAFISEDPVQVIVPIQEKTMAFLDRTPSEIIPLFSPERDSEESFTDENTETEYDHILTSSLAENLGSDTESESYESAADSSANPDEDLPLQVYGDFLSEIDEENIHISPAGSEENDDDKPIIEIIRMDELTDLEEPLPFDVTEISDPEMPGNIYEAVVEGIVENEQISPIEIPVVMEEHSYILPEDPSQHPIIFPDEILPRHDLPVFPQQWSPDSASQPANNEHTSEDNPVLSFGFSHEPSGQEIKSSYYSPLPFQGPSYSPPPIAHAHSYGSLFDSPSSYNPLSFEVPPFDSSAETDDYSPKFPMEELADITDEMPVQLPKVKSPSEVFEFALFGNDNSNTNEPTTHFHLSSDDDENPMISNVDEMINDFGPFGMTSVPSMAFHQDFHGPNTFPLNLRTTDFTPDHLNGRYRDIILPQNHNTPSYFPNGYTLPLSPQEEISSPESPNSMSGLPNVFFSSLSESGGMLKNPNEEDISMNFKEPDTPDTAETHQNSRPYQQEYDIQVSFIPYQNSYGFRPYDGHGHLHFRYPVAQYTDSFSSYQRFPYSFPSYSESIPYQNSGYYPPQPLKKRYNPGFNYRDQYDHYLPYNYPTPRW